MQFLRWIKIIITSKHAHADIVFTVLQYCHSLACHYNVCVGRSLCFVWMASYKSKKNSSSTNQLELRPGLELSGGWRGSTPQFMSTDAHFWVKIGLKLQSMGKISNISAADPPVLRSIPTLVKAKRNSIKFLVFFAWLSSAHMLPHIRISPFISKPN